MPSLTAIKPQEVHQVVHAGSGFSYSCTPRDSRYVVVAIDSCSAVGCVKASPGEDPLAVFTCSVNPTTGVVTAELSPAQTLALQDTPFFVWDVVLIRGTEAQRLAFGDGVTIPAVVRATDPDPSGGQAIYEFGETWVTVDSFETDIEFATEKAGEYWVESLNILNVAEDAEPLGVLGTKSRTALKMTAILSGQVPRGDSHKISWAVRVK